MNRRQLLIAAITGLCLPTLIAPQLCRAARWLPCPAIPSVTLLDQHNRPRALADLLEADMVAISFMFTGCSTVCPPQTALLRAAWQQLQSDSQAPELRNLRVISITVDPYGDGPAQLLAYAERFKLPADDWVLLTGEADAVLGVLSAFGISMSRVNDHPAMLWLADTRRNRWTRTSSLNPPHAIVELLQALSA
jgi:protein SCO1/2